MKNKVIKKVEYNKLVSKADKIDTTVLLLKDTYDTDKSNLETKISDVDKKFLMLVVWLEKQISLLRLLK